MFAGLLQHHIGCLVANIDEFINDNTETWPVYNYSEIYNITSQDVRVCFLQFSDDTRIELVEPGPGNSALSKMIGKGICHYHIGFLSTDFDGDASKLDQHGFRQISVFSSEAFEGKRCAFFYHPQLRLLELIEE